MGLLLACVVQAVHLGQCSCPHVRLCLGQKVQSMSEGQQGRQEARWHPLGAWAARRSCSCLGAALDVAV